jgi:GAF domain-containing protein
VNSHRPAAHFAEVAARRGVKHSMSVGLPIGTSTVAGLNRYGLRGDPFDDAAIDLARTFAGHAAIAVANAAALADAVEAFRLLVQASNHSNRKLRDIAQPLVDNARH